MHTIFLFAAGDDPDWAPTTLSHCCKTWREDSLASPLLWKRIAFRKPLAGKPIHQLGKQQLVWIERTQNALLDIEIGEKITRKNRKESQTFGVQSVPRILEIVLPHVERWGSLALHGLSSRAWDYVLDASQQYCAPEIRRLSIMVRGVNRRTVDIFDRGDAMDKVEELELGPSASFHTLNILHFRNLKVFRCPETSFGLGSLHLLLQNNPLLEHITINALHPHAERGLEYESQDELYAQYLREIHILSSISLGDVQHDALVLLKINAPSLTQVAPYLFTPAAVEQIANSPRPFPKILRFGLSNKSWFGGPRLQSDRFLAALEKFQNLEFLGLYYGNMIDSDDWQKYLVYPLSNSFPFLKHLCLQLIGDLKLHPQGRLCVTLSDIMYIVQARLDKPNLATLETLDVGPRLVDAEDKEWFRSRVRRFIHSDPYVTVR